MDPKKEHTPGHKRKHGDSSGHHSRTKRPRRATRERSVDSTQYVRMRNAHEHVIRRHDKLIKTLSAADAASAELRHKNIELRSKYAQLRTKCDQLELALERATLSGHATERVADRSALLQEVRSIKRQLDRQTKKKEHLKNKNAELKQKLKALDEANSSLHERCMLLETIARNEMSDNEKLRAELTQANKQIDKMQLKLEQRTLRPCAPPVVSLDCYTPRATQASLPGIHIEAESRMQIPRTETQLVKIDPTLLHNQGATSTRYW